MRKLPNRSSSKFIFAAASLLLNVFLLSSSSIQADANISHAATVSEFASFNTPGAVDGRVEAIAVDGDTVYVGGTFTQIQNPVSDEIIDRPYLFAYSKSSGNIIETFDPQLNGSVLALATTGEAAGGVFAGGGFGNLNGEASRGRLAKIGIDGDRIGGFSGRSNGSVNSMVRHGNTLYVGGTFDAINGTAVENLAALDVATGIVDPSLNLDFDGTITTTRTPDAVQGVQNIDITSDGRLLAVNGNFLEVGGQSRPRLALLELDGQARVSTWNTNVFDGDCPSGRFPNYILGIDISPDDSYLLTASSGFRRRGEPNCDTTVRFELDDLTNDDVQPTWVNYTGGDSVYDVLSTEHAVYIGGHFEFLNNDLGGGNFAGPGSQARRGLAALDPINGLTLLDWRSDRNPRGLGVFAFVAEPEGIYLGDDTDFLNGSEHKKFKFLPVSDDVVERPQVPSLPTTILINDLPDESLYSRSFDGSSIGAQVALQDHTFGAGVVGAILADDQLFHFRNNDSVLVSTLTDGAFETSDEVDLFGLTGNDWDISQIGGIFFDHDFGRVYYTLRGDSQLYWRAFTPSSPYFGNDEYVADQQADILWSDVTGMDVIDGHLYFTRSDSTLYRAQVEGYEPVTGTTQAISASAIDGQSWDGSFLTFGTLGAANTGGNSSSAEFEFENSGSQTVRTNRTYEFPVEPGESTVVRLSWLDVDAELHLRIRDADGELVASDLTRAGSPKWLTVPAGNGGIYSASVQIAEGATAYTLQINPDEEPPAPLADFVFISTGSANDGRFQRFDFAVNAGELIEASLSYDISDADIELTVRDETNTLVEREGGQNGAATLSVVAESSGVWSVVVLVDNADDVDYDVLVNTLTDFVLPEPLADFEFSSSGFTDSDRFQRFDFEVNAGELIEARVNYDISDAVVRFDLRDEANTLVEREDGLDGSAMLSTVAETSGVWSAVVRVDNDVEVNFDVLVDTLTDFVLPEPLADFEFSSSGFTDSDRFQRFDFEVNAGELIEARVNYDIPDAVVRFDLRDEANTLIEREDGLDGSAMLSTVAETSGVWSAVVRVDNDVEVNFDVLVDTLTDFVLPEPLADFEFSSSGFTDSGRFQRFDFEVNAGEVIEAGLAYDVPGAEVRFDLRDETNKLIERQTGVEGFAMLSTVAETSGIWSAIVRVDNDVEVNYDVLVDTLTNLGVP